MKQNLILPIIAITLLLASCKKNQETSTAPTLEVYADSLFQASIDSSQIAGASILVFQKGNMLLKKTYGYASLELSTPMPSDGIFLLPL